MAFRIRFGNTGKSSDKADRKEQIRRAKEQIAQADTIVIGAGAGLSTAAGFTYSGERFERYFGDFGEKYHFQDMYSGGFYPYRTPEENWGYWSRFVYVNRYMSPPKQTYGTLFNMVRQKDYFVITTNVDHCFQKAGFAKSRLYYTQGDYGLLQCSRPCHERTYDNRDQIREMVLAQGFSIDASGILVPPQDGIGKVDYSKLGMEIPKELVPRCPVCGEPMSMNLRADDTFVEDEGWHLAAERYWEFLDSHKKSKILFLELGVGYNTPGIIKYPFWRMTQENREAFYVCLNYEDAGSPAEIADRSICIGGDADEVIAEFAAALR